MSRSKFDVLEEELANLLGDALPDRAVHDIHAAMALGEILETRGFRFQLKDLCPRSMSETAWRATFTRDGEAFSADDSQSSVAVCMAAVGALTSLLPGNHN